MDDFLTAMYEEYFKAKVALDKEAGIPMDGNDPHSSCKSNQREAVLSERMGAMLFAINEYLKQFKRV
jgi:hypothetical protein